MSGEESGEVEHNLSKPSNSIPCHLSTAFVFRHIAS